MPLVSISPCLLSDNKQWLGSQTMPSISPVLPAPKGHWPCLCGSQTVYRACCRPWHLGGEPDHAEQVMRARFTAYAWGKISFLMRTTHSQHPDAIPNRDAWWLSLSQAVLEVRYDHLRILKTHEDQHQAEITFAASGLCGGERIIHRETSLFLREGMAWRYRSGDVQDVGFGTPKRVPKV
jgi:SEC-C motif-containing protein